jgi:hypothetical protein
MDITEPDNDDRSVVLSMEAREGLHRLNHSLGQGGWFKEKVIPGDLDQGITAKVISSRILGLDHSIGKHHQHIAWPQG